MGEGSRSSFIHARQFMIRFLLLLLAILCATPAVAGESASVVTSRVVATLVSDSDSAAPGQTIRLALRLRLADGWHTYWRNPGDAGAPPELTLDLPAGATAGPIDWPTPHRLAEGPIMTYAYTGEVLLPLRVTFLSGGTTIRAEARWLVCKDICVPEEGTFSLDLRPAPSAPSAQTPLFDAHARAVPRPSPWPATISAQGVLTLTGAELSPATVAEAWFIPDASGLITDDAPQRLSVAAGGLSLGLVTPKPLTALSGIVSIRDRSGQQTDVAILAEAGSTTLQETIALPTALLFAFLGGLILNLMPCVFPILAMKAVGLTRGAASGAGAGHAVAYTAGVLVTFAGLGAVLLLTRAAGSAVGWGFQFQSPVFVAAMAVLLFAVGLNLSGVFQVGGGLASAGSGLAGRSGHAGSFFTGLLAVLVATPCTAPFMGAAIAAGLAAPPAVTIAVFLVMGLGLAAPYALLAANPAIARHAPRPGAWMDVLKQALAFPMYAACLWLIWVLAQQSGPPGILSGGIALVLIGFAAWVFGLSQRAEGRAAWGGKGLAVVAAAIAVLSLATVAETPPDSAGAPAERYSPERLSRARAEGRAVFVNMTAAWCVTCLVNERVVLSSDAVRGAFAARGVVYLKGDWTRQDPAITSFLREHGRDGVPLYVLFPGGNTPSIQFPQILTQPVVLDALGVRTVAP